jgi:hypothetical protein
MNLEHANLFHLILMVILCSIILYTVITARRGKEYFIRRIPGLAAIDETIGRATEMGRPMLYSTGLNLLGSPETLQSISIMTYVARQAARYGNRLIVPAYDPMMVAVVEEVLREAWTAEGKPEAHRPDDIRFLSDQQFAFAAAMMGLVIREKVASVFLFGYFYAESLLLAEAGQEAGAIQVAGTPATTQIPFFIVACDYTIIGDEYYAATAYLTKEPTLLGSLVGQDISKAILLAMIVIGTIVISICSFHPVALKMIEKALTWIGGS